MKNWKKCNFQKFFRNFKGFSHQNHEKNMQALFEKQALKEILLENKNEEAKKIREQLDNLVDDKNEEDIQKYYQKS